MKSIFDELLAPAMEAPIDLSNAVDARMDAITGRSSNGGSGIARDTGGRVADNIMSTNILGDDESPEGGDDNESSSTDTDTTGDTNDAEETEDQDSGETSTDETESSENEEPESTEEEQEPSPFDKNKLKNSMIFFLNIITSNIDTLRECMTNTTDSNTITIFNRVIDNFEECKRITYECIADDDWGSMPYTELLKKYIAVNRIHELGISMLELKENVNLPKNLKRNRPTKF